MLLVNRKLIYLGFPVFCLNKQNMFLQKKKNCFIYKRKKKNKKKKKIIFGDLKKIVLALYRKLSTWVRKGRD